MASFSNRYTFAIAVRSDAYPACEAFAAEVTAHFADDLAEPQTLALHRDAQSVADAEQCVYSASLVLQQPNAVSRAVFRIDGCEIDPAAPPQGIVSVSTKADQAPLAEDAQALPAEPVDTNKNVCKVDSAISSCADLPLADIQNASSSEQPASAMSELASGPSADTDAAAADAASASAPATDETVSGSAENAAEAIASVVAIEDASGVDRAVAEAPVEAAIDESGSPSSEEYVIVSDIESSSDTKEPIAGESAEATRDTIPETTPESSAETAAESVAKSIVEETSEPVAEAVPETLAEPASEPAAEPVSDVAAGPASDAVADPDSKAVAESAPETATELEPDAPAERVGEPVPEPTVEPSVAP
ncbi:hypothetical protein LPJ75_005311, partial [Coemansia sp. RSA 2598]